DRWLQLLHGAYLHRGRVRAQQQLLAPSLRFLIGEEQRVLRVPRGMVRREVQRLEIVVVGFNHRAFSDRVAEVLEYADDLIHGADDRVLGADGPANAGKGNVDLSGNWARRAYINGLGRAY